jgi:hypothetical protein
MEFRRPTAGERRLLLELARLARMDEPEGWVDALKVRELKDGGMGSLELGGPEQECGHSGLVVPLASVQFADDDGVEVVATLNARESGLPFELDVWKTDFSPLRRIPITFRGGGI